MVEPLFGLAAPKFIYDPGGVNEEIVLDYSVIQKDELKPDIIVHKSVLNGHREFINKGSHHLFEVRIHLHKYTDKAARLVKLKELKSYLTFDVILYRHSDGVSIKNLLGDPVLYTITEIEEGYYKTPDFKDIVTIAFQSKDYVDFSNSGVEEIFDPLTLANYQAGYLMNLTTDDPAGSILASAQSQWVDAILLNATAKYFQANATPTFETINGLKAYTIKGATSYLRNITFDVFNSLTDFTFLIGFQKADNGTNNNIIFYRQNSDNSQQCWLNMQSGGVIEVLMRNTTGAATIVNVSTAEVYDDNLPHCIVAVFNQSTKTVHLYTDKGEHITDTDAAYVSMSLDAGDAWDIWLANWAAETLSFNPGLLGDVIILNEAADETLVGQLLAWEGDRLGISVTPF